MIPEAKKEAVACALREAFGVTGYDDIQMMTAGLSPALIFRIVVRGQPYLLRLIVSTNATAGPGRGDQTHHFACMKSAAEAGIGPRVWYTNIEDRISITDFVSSRPFPRNEAVLRLPATLRTLHALPTFPFPRAMNYLDVMDGFVRKFQAAKILPEGEAGPLFAGYARVASVYPRDDSDMVSSHNDLKPENILFDGYRVWLVDWEAGSATTAMSISRWWRILWSLTTRRKSLIFIRISEKRRVTTDARDFILCASSFICSTQRP